MADFPPPPPPGTDPPQPGGYQPQPAWQAPPPAGAYGASPAFGAPPAYAAAGYGYGYGAPPAMKALGGLATALTVLLAIMLLVDLAAAAAFFDRASLLDDASASFVDIADADDRVAGAGGGYFLGLLVTGVVWVIWQFRYVKNVQALGRPTGFDPGFAIGGWFIPIASWFIPERQLAVSAKSSDPAPGGTPSTPGVLYGWWATWVASTVLVFAAIGTRPDDDELFSSTTLEDFQSADRMQGVGMVIGAACAVLAILTVRACTKRQQQLVGQLASGTATGQTAYQQQPYQQQPYQQQPYQQQPYQQQPYQQQPYQQPAYPQQPYQQPQPAYPPQQPPPYQPPAPPSPPPYQPPAPPPPPYQPPAPPPDQPPPDQPPTTF